MVKIMLTVLAGLGTLCVVGLFFPTLYVEGVDLAGHHVAYFWGVLALVVWLCFKSIGDLVLTRGRLSPNLTSKKGRSEMLEPNLWNRMVNRIRQAVAFGLTLEECHESMVTSGEVNEEEFFFLWQAAKILG